MLINYEKVTAHLQDIRTGKIKEGLTLGLSEIDTYFRFKPSSFNIILGHSNTGKTTIVLYLMLAYAIKHQLKWLIFSSENEAYSIIRKLVELLDLCKVIKDAWDYQGLLIDPYNSLIKDPKLIGSVGGHEYDYQATTELRIFAKKNNIAVWVNTHANTNALRITHRIDHEYAGHPIPPNAADVEGGGKFVNRADDFLVVHRYIQHPTEFMYSMIHVRKVKETETGGRPTNIDEPIRLKALRNNVGFSVDNISILKKIVQPF